jgi:hypothetical protein
MARIRTVKPSIARHRELFNLEAETGIPFRYVWALMPTICDRAGRFQWRPWELKLDIMPYDQIDFERVLHALVTRGFLVKYAWNGMEYGCIPTFEKHQVINAREKPSELPAFDAEGSTILSVPDYLPTREARVEDASVTRERLGFVEPVGKGREGKGKGREGEGKISRKSENSASPALPMADAKSNDSKKTSEFIRAYTKLWSEKHGARCDITGADQGSAKRLAKGMSAERFVHLLTAYFSMPDAYFLKARHPLPLFETRIKEVATFADSGEYMTQRQASDADAFASNLVLLNQIRRGET